MGIFEQAIYNEGATLEDAIRYKRYLVMKQMGWSYQEYINTPAHIVDEVAMFLKTDNKITEQQIRGA